jgi:hypothetical protein
MAMVACRNSGTVDIGRHYAHAAANCCNPMYLHDFIGFIDMAALLLSMRVSGAWRSGTNPKD